MTLRSSFSWVAVALLLSASSSLAAELPPFRLATSADLKARVPLMVPMLVSKDSTKERLALRLVLLAGMNHIAIFSSQEQLALAAHSIDPTDQMIFMDRGALCDSVQQQTLLVLDLGSRDSLIADGALLCSTFPEDQARIRKLKQQQAAPNQPLHPTPTAAEAPASGAGERRR